MFAKGFFPGGYYPGGYFPPLGTSPVGAPPDYDLVLHAGNVGAASVRMEQMPRSLRLHSGNAEAIILRD